MNQLSRAADEGDIELVRTLIAQDVTQAGKDLALARACCSGHLQIAELLLDEGADANGQYESEPGKFEYGPIILAACEFLNVEGLKWLLDHGASPDGNPPNTGDFQCMTPLQMVRDTYVNHEQRRLACMQTLLTAGAAPIDDHLDRQEGPNWPTDKN